MANNGLTFPRVVFNTSAPAYRRHTIAWTSTANPLLPLDDDEPPPPLLDQLDTSTDFLPRRGPALGVGALAATAAAMANRYLTFLFQPVVLSPSTPTTHHPIPGNGNVAANFDDEPPLLEELDIDTGLIWRKAVSFLHPFRSVDPSVHADADLSGPVLILFSLALFQLLAGKLHFGIVLGWATAASVFLFFISSMLLWPGRGGRGELSLYRCASVLGYCMLSMTILSAVSLFLARGGGLMFGMGMGFVLWSTRVCSRLLVACGGHGDEHRGLIAYPCFLVFMIFSLLVIF
ncbi:protein YIPF5 [Hordeum vulgare]|nr:protein YIPF5 [Hordeum vulgare]